jgi:hypothetical protein
MAKRHDFLVILFHSDYLFTKIAVYAAFRKVNKIVPLSLLQGQMTAW